MDVMTNEIHYLTPEGLSELQTELKYLTEVRQVELTQRLQLTRQEGSDFYDNAEYLDAKREYDLIEEKIIRIGDILNRAHAIKPKHHKNRVEFGSRVTIVEKGSQQKETYILVDSAEANPREGKISDQSPMGHALLGAKVGNTVVVDAPDGKIVFTVKAVE